MSYVKLNPSYYQMLNPESPWHPGAEGWSVAPYPGWGENPNLVGPKRLGVEGLGIDIAVTSDRPDCSGDKQMAAAGGFVIGGTIVGILSFLLTRK